MTTSAIDPITQVRTPHKSGRALLRPSYRAGQPDSHSVDTPCLFWHHGRYRMFHNCFDGIGYRSGLASSDDLLNWDREGIVLERGEPGSITEFNAHITCVLRDPDLYSRGETRLVDNKLLGVWQAYPERGQEQGKGVIGIARGGGLCDWTLEASCLRPEDGAAWERGGLYKPNLIENNGRFYIFYNAKEVLDWPWHEQIGVAWSDDLVTWTRHPEPVVANGNSGSWDELFAADPWLARSEDGTWIMFYYGLAADGHARELVAFSEDLLHWRKSDEVLIDVGPAGSLDAQYAHKPSVIAKDGVLYHFYSGSRRKADGETDEVNAKDRRVITVATSQALST
jgi:predicted GH43/DUF377 family glycosyl hydrolase